MTEPIPMARWPRPTREAAEAYAKEFAPRMGLNYTSGRNFDHGPGKHRNVSRLSPYIRRRLLLERDIVEIALREHGEEGAGKFVQEVIWRGYFKGWLEHRPQIWRSYRNGLDSDWQKLDRDARLRHDVELAETGQTDLDCFNAWAQELVETGYLHNHARMWFASIWIFTLRLPWRLGADFFYRHLLDGDPASNTLSWRWVAGLHTRGKFYQAQPSNIAKFTDHRFAPNETDLAEVTAGLEVEEPNGLANLQPLRAPRPPDPGAPTALLITEEDCRPEDFPIDDLVICGTATLAASSLRSLRPTATKVVEFEAAALADTAQRIATQANNLQAGDPVDLADWAAGTGAKQLVTPYIPEGPLRDWLNAADPALKQAGIALCEWRRDWDKLIWPHATAGFFKVKKKIPQILCEAGLS